MSFEKLQENLRKRGWFVEWNLPCCQSCAWAEVPLAHQIGPYENEEVDFDKVLFNHSQDCEVELDPPDFGDDIDAEEEWWDNYDPVHNSPQEQKYSYFCFSGDKKGVNNLIEVLPIIEQSGCSWDWDKKGTSRIEISWE